MNVSKNKSSLLIIIVIVIGSFGTFLSAFLFYQNVSQEDYLYEDIPFQKGMSFTTWGAASFNSSEARAEVFNMKEAGIEWVGVNIWWIQESVDSTEIYDGPWTDTDANITAFFNFVHAQGMKVLFKPMLDTEDGVWRSYIEASPEWIEEYNRFIKYTAKLAENGSADILSIGCEMGNWQVKEDEVVKLIEDVRDIYSGKLTYAANHDSFWYINFWDKLDIIGVDAYFPFTLSYDPTEEDMIQVWDSFYAELEKFQRKWNKPILFIELGCQNRDGCNIAPNDVKFSDEQDEEEFRMYYTSLFKSKIWRASWFKGTYWWMWDLQTVDEDSDTGFSPKSEIIQSTLDTYYNAERDIIYPNYWAEFILIIALGALITAVSSFILKKSFQKGNLDLEEIETNFTDETNDATKYNHSGETRLRSMLSYTVGNGILLGLFLFWTFTYYNQSFFNMIYGIATKSIFLEGGIIPNLFAILATFIIIILLWSLFQRLIASKKEHTGLFISLLALGTSCIIISIRAFFTNSLVNELSIRYFLIVAVMPLLAIMFSVNLLYGYPALNLKSVNEKAMQKSILFLILGILFISVILLLILSFLLSFTVEIPALISGILLVVLIPSFFSKIIVEDHKYPSQPSQKFKDSIKITPEKILEFSLSLYILGYYFGILRHYDPHVLINFNLGLVTQYLIPISLSLIVGILIILSFIKIYSKKSNSETFLISFNESETFTTTKYFPGILLFSVVLLVFTQLLGGSSLYLVLLVGGIPIIMIFLILLIKNLPISNSEGSEECYWKRFIIYLPFIMTVGFTLNGIAISLLYILTFFTIKDGQIVVQIAFEESLGFDAIQMIYNIQLFIALVLIGFSALGYLIAKRKFRHTEISQI